MKIVLIDVNQPKHEVVKSYCLRTLAATELTQDGKNYIFWPLDWFDSDRKLVKQFAKGLKGFIPATSNKAMKAVIREDGAGFFAPEKTVSFINLIKYYRKRNGD